MVLRCIKKKRCTDKNKRIINNSNKIINAIELFKSMTENDEFKVTEEYHAKPNNNINLDWMNDKDGYLCTAKEAGGIYERKKQ